MGLLQLSELLSQEGGLARQDTQLFLGTCRSSEFASAKERFDAAHQRQQKVLAQLRPEVLIGRLYTAAQEADQHSDVLYDEFLGGSKAVDAFVPEYSKQRTLFHIRELKCSAARSTLT